MFFCFLQVFEFCDYNHTNIAHAIMSCKDVYFVFLIDFICFVVCIDFNVNIFVLQNVEFIAKLVLFLITMFLHFFTSFSIFWLQPHKHCKCDCVMQGSIPFFSYRFYLFHYMHWFYCWFILFCKIWISFSVVYLWCRCFCGCNHKHYSIKYFFPLVFVFFWLCTMFNGPLVSLPFFFTFDVNNLMWSINGLDIFVDYHCSDELFIDSCFIKVKIL